MAMGWGGGLGWGAAPVQKISIAGGVRRGVENLHEVSVCPANLRALIASAKLRGRLSAIGRKGG